VPWKSGGQPRHSKQKFFGGLTWVAESLAAREPLNADAVSYLNMAGSYLSGTWHGLINGWWSPVRS
jgi:hypothetical protein